MGKDTNEALLRILDEFQLSQDEKSFVKYSDTANTGEMNHSRVISTLLLTKQLKLSTDRVIESNQLLAEAEDRNSKKMQWLTWALIGVGVLQVAGILLK